MATQLIVLAAGQGTRMLSDRPKVLHEIGHAPMFAHALASGAALAPERTVLVVGHGAEEVAKAAHEIDEAIAIAVQAEQKGTAHAVLAAARHFGARRATRSSSTATRPSSGLRRSRPCGRPAPPTISSSSASNPGTLRATAGS
jgi:CTP:molybdopterin cytidylyltransferase MocA